MQLFIDDLMTIAEFNDIKYFGVAMIILFGSLIIWRLSK